MLDGRVFRVLKAISAMMFIYVTKLYGVHSMGVLYHTRMVHTICVYAYGITIRVWYGLLYHTRMVHMRHTGAYS